MRQSLTDRAYTAIHERITTGKMVPGAMLNEVLLAKSLSMSRTPVRDAIRQLEKDGLLERKNGRIVVAEITYSRAADIYVLRAAIEGTAARLAAATSTSENLDELRQIMEKAEEAIKDHDVGAVVQLHLEYHNYVVAMSQNSALIAASAQANALIRRFRHIGAASFGRLSESTAFHKAVFEALASHDADRCEALMREDVLGGGAALLSVLQVFFGIDKVTPSVTLVLEHAGSYRDLV